jgi:hypothetical protein
MRISGALWSWKSYNKLVDLLKVKAWDRDMYDVVKEYETAYTFLGPDRSHREFLPIRDAIKSIRLILSVPLAK